MSNEPQKTGDCLTVAVPTAEGQLAMHFGHCQEFAVFDIDKTSNEITGQRRLTPPPHEPGVLPAWLHEQGADVIIAGGMGGRAQALFAQRGIQVVTGAPAEPPEKIVLAYISGKLETGQNLCDH